MASVKAKPKIVQTKSCLVREGFRATDTTRAEKTRPIPTPAPANDIVAKPAPIN